MVPDIGHTTPSLAPSLFSHSWLAFGFHVTTTYMGCVDFLSYAFTRLSLALFLHGLFEGLARTYEHVLGIIWLVRLGIYFGRNGYGFHESRLYEVRLSTMFIAVGGVMDDASHR